MYTTVVKSIALAGAGLLAATGLALAAPVQTIESDLGEVLADMEGYVLYTFRNDEPGMSNCYETCAANWPPFFADAADEQSEAFTLVTREDGTLQWAQDGWPLYYWINDVMPGDVTGDGVGGNWDVARP